MLGEVVNGLTVNQLYTFLLTAIAISPPMVRVLLVQVIGLAPRVFSAKLTDGQRSSTGQSVIMVGGIRKAFWLEKVRG